MNEPQRIRFICSRKIASYPSPCSTFVVPLLKCNNLHNTLCCKCMSTTTGSSCRHTSLARAIIVLFLFPRSTIHLSIYPSTNSISLSSVLESTVMFALCNMSIGSAMGLAPKSGKDHRHHRHHHRHVVCKTVTTMGVCSRFALGKIRENCDCSREEKNENGAHFVRRRESRCENKNL